MNNLLKESKPILMKCAKCSSTESGGAMHVSGSYCYWLCGTCQAVMKDCPHLTLRSFLGEKHENWLKKSHVDRAMQEAKERRARGESPWLKQETSVVS